MKSYFRFLSKNKLYTTIEVAGMAIAIAFVLFIGSFAIQEIKTDSAIKRQGNIYVGHSERMFIGCATVKEQLEGKFPEVEAMCRVIGTHIFGGIEMDMIVDGQKERQNSLITDENFFEFFPFELVEGNPEAVLKEKYAVIISQSCANRLFGDEEALGKNIEVVVNGNRADLHVTGIYKDFSHTIFFVPDIIYRVDLLSELDQSMTVNGSGIAVLFYRLAEGTDVKSLEDKIESVLKKEDMLYVHQLFKEYHLTSFADISKLDLEATIPFEGIVRADFTNLFASAGLFLLLFAVFNYISLTVAQTGFRAKEMASRRLLGTQIENIIFRYIGESFILTLVSFAFALLIVGFISPYLSMLVGKEVSPFSSFGWRESVFFLSVLILLSLCSGIIPALIVSRYKPIDVVRGNFTRTSKMTLGKILIGFQSFIAFISLSVAGVIYLQINYMIHKSMGYEKNGIISVQNAAKPSDYHVDELRSLSCVENVGWLQFDPMTLGSSVVSVFKNGGELKLDVINGTQSAFEILGFKVIRQNAEPLPYRIWLTESALKALGVDYDCTELEFDNTRFSVCGIIEDFHKGSAVTPMKTEFLKILQVMDMEKDEDFRVLRKLAVKVHGDEHEALNEIKTFYRNKGLTEDDIKVKTYNEINYSLYDAENKSLKLLMIFTALILLLTSMAMFAMSTYYARQHAKEVALRKVMGCEGFQLFVETSSRFLKAVLIAVLVSIPLSWYVSGIWLENYSYRIDNPIQVYVLSLLFMLCVALVSVSWQILRLIHTNPVKTLKNE